ncbi:uncharacterized protein RCC_09005 [Ramularia collo-cygni]|uniref:Uncharacterized protein n=1 Tax=Ramularia collo-cygni TaxID=112498 RepID=A0A2D3VLB4_9PEZI|nr:uncharacterized protein RCC_09005 [Ramularia collo-cygni]CZT23294.1 uncharacterized protein RCC_09005 [Ramularia collo-cygni]
MDPPRVSKRGHKLHLSYELPHRIHAARIYPLLAPNGSTLIIYAHDHGLRLLWRGGRRRRGPSMPPKSNGVKHDEMILIDDTDDAQDGDEWEAEEEELDPDCPCPHIIHTLDIVLGRDASRPDGCAVLHLELPVLHSSPSTPTLLKKMAIVAVALADGSCQILQLPLTPPSAANEASVADNIYRSAVELTARGTPIPASLAIKFLPADETRPRSHSGPLQSLDDQLLIATASRTLSIWAVSVKTNKLVCSENTLVRKTPLSSSAVGISFHPSSRLGQLLLTDTSGAARIFDLHKPRSSTQAGDWIMAYHTSHHIPKDTPDLDPTLTRRKKILGAEWVLAGKGILVLQEDGEWGIWDVNSSQTGKQVEDFALRGFLGTSSSTEQTEPSKSKRGVSKLAPMTPNTRKTKAEQLFTGAVRAPGVAPSGGITVQLNNPRIGQADESVAIWYGGEVYSITSTQAFWQRSTSSGGGFGSLHAPGLSHITDISLSNETISSISQFSVKGSAGLGQMNTQRDLLVSAEHRAVVLQTQRPDKPARNLFQRQIDERPAEAMRDQHMLDAGGLDVEGLDRMLEDMAAGTTNTVTRKVGFAS